MFKKQDIQDVYELSPLQQGMLFHYLHDEGSQSYFEQIDFSLEGVVQHAELEGSFRQLIQKYEVFRTVFVYEKVKQPVQVVLKERTAGIPFVDLTGERDIEMKIEQFKQQERLRGFDLASELPIRFVLYKTGERRYRLIWSFHHIIMDGWCLGIVLNDFFAMYRKRVKGQLYEVKGTAPPYSEYIRWLAKQNPVTAQDYWHSYLSGFEQPSELPLKRPTDARTGYKMQDMVRHLGLNISTGLSELAKRYQVTLNTVIQAAWGVLLQRYNNTSDAVFGTIVSGRPAAIPNVEQIVGLFINTVPVRVQCSPNDNFAALLEKLQLAAVESESFSYMSLADIQSGTSCSKALFSHLLAFENYPFEPDSAKGQEEDDGFTIVDAHTFEQTNYDFNLLVLPGRDIVLKCTFNAVAFDYEHIETVLKQFVSILEQVIDQPEQAIGMLDLPVKEREELLEVLNRTECEYPRNSMLHELFEQQVALWPEQTALVQGEKKISYEELNTHANRLARRLEEAGVKPGDRVGVCLERATVLYSSLLAVLKVGAAYVPIDPEYPAERISYMLKDSDVRTLLTTEELGRRMHAYMTGIECVNAEEEKIKGLDGTNLTPRGTSEDIAYVMYTSGSTGQPKGILTTHRNVVRTIVNNGYLSIYPEDRLLQLSNPAFDGSTFEIYGALLHGARLVVIPQETVLDARELSSVIREEGITVTFMTTALFNALVESELSCLKQLRKILFGGEKASIKHVRKAVEQLGEGKLLHVYGPTETTVFATSYEVDEAALRGGSVPIGRPIGNTTTYVLNAEMKLVPKGVPGELYIGGEGVSQAYLNRPELTSERYVESPFRSGERLYRTGDLVRWLPEGHLEFIDRLDNQVKIRGFRIELGEVEAAISSHPEVKEVIVHVTEDRRLVAYIVVEHEVDGVAVKVRGAMKEQLPSYMIPSAIIELPAFPLNANGKVDRRALPAPSEMMQERSGYEAPSTPLEKELARVWQEVLQLDQVGIHDHFFERGGHSLKAMMLVSRIMKQLQLQISVRTVFANPILGEMASHLEKVASSGQEKFIERVAPRPYYPVTSVQKRLYALQLLDGVHTAYNIPLMLRIKGKLDVIRLEEAFKALIQRHESLRTSFRLVEGELMQHIEETVAFQLELLEAENHQGGESVAAKFVQPFDLAQAPLFRSTLVFAGVEEQLLLIDMHHIISDGVSMGVMIQELSELYQGRELPALLLQVKDYAVWEERFRQSEAFHTQKIYWLNQFNREIPRLELPTDFVRPAIQSFEGELHEHMLSTELSQKLRALASEKGVTLFTTLLAAYYTLLYHYSGESDIVVGTTVAGRSSAELEPVIGMFVRTLAIRTSTSPHETFEHFLLAVHQHMLDVYENDDYPLDQLIESLGERRDISRNPLFDTMFVLQNMDMSEFAIPGLTITQEPYKWQSSKVDMSWTVTDGLQLHIMVEYCTGLFKQGTVSRMIQKFIHLLEQITSNPNRLLGELSILSAEEREELLEVLNRTECEYPRNSMLHELFEQQAALWPEQTALVQGEKKISYEELNTHANRLARRLEEAGVKPGDRVGVCLERATVLYSSLLAVLKVGAAYVPIDPEYPAERISYMLKDSDVRTLLTTEELGRRMHAYMTGIECVNAEEEKIKGLDGTNLTPRGTSEDIAYVMYTSGSTGQPKGILTTHRNVVRTIVNNGYLSIYPEDRLLQLSNPAFDGSTFEIYGALLHGARLVVIPQETVLDARELSSVIREEGITVTFMTTALFNALVESELSCLKQLRKILFGGEKASIKHVRKAVEQLGEGKLLHVYGPTETTVFATSYEVDEAALRGGSVPIGRPIGNTTTYVLNAEMKLVPKGVPGELYIGGEGVSQAYLNRPELTSERYVESPFRSGERLYRTGDLVRWLPEGHLEFIDRLDNQVKIRGFRIELGEVEAAISSHPEVKEVIVHVTEDRRLVAYIVVEHEVDGVAVKVRGAMKEQLPSYMIPSAIIELPAFPLNANGKVDRRALPAPSEMMQERSGYEAPSTPLEKELARVWQEVLQLDQVGAHDHFFEIGGDSIKGMQVIAKLAHNQWKLSMKQLYLYPTISQLSLCLEVLPSSISHTVAGEIPLTPIQHWLFETAFDVIHDMHINIVLENKSGWETEAVQRAVRKIVEHHDALRIVFRQEQRICQCNREIAEEGLFSFQTVDLTRTKDAISKMTEHVHRVNAETDLTQGPLLKAAMFLTDETEYVVLSIHHLVMDDISANILMEDFIVAYDQAKSGEELKLPPKTASYQQWSRGLTEYANSEAFLYQLPYWLNLEQTKIKPLPKDKKGNALCSLQDMDVVLHAWSLEDSNRLFSYIDRDSRADAFQVMLCALGLAVRSWNGAEHVLVNLERHGREDILDGLDVTRTVGWFNAHSPFAIPVANADWQQTLQRVKKDIAAVPNKGIGHSILKYLTSPELKRGLIHQQPEISFNYHGKVNEGVKEGIIQCVETIGNSFNSQFSVPFSLYVNIIVLQGRLHIRFGYNQNLFHRETIEQLVTKYSQILEESVAGGVLR
ncbi:amino acid adenylation domain-containing protein [Paenibacillus sp. QZ-Y1]|uniref:amino acid adenylation domain-containing protein n=1 Tax=Paenibacillus sp. QZ-Y1 TaxID=3414511 RepID=UPI003F7ABE50